MSKLPRAQIFFLFIHTYTRHAAFQDYGSALFKPVSRLLSAPVFTWKDLEASLLVLPATVLSGLWLLGVLYFVLEVRPPAHWRASAHFFSEISRFRCAKHLGRGIARASAWYVQLAQPFHPTGVWLPRRNLCPFVGLFIAGDFLVCQTPPNLDYDARRSPP